MRFTILLAGLALIALTTIPTSTEGQLLPDTACGFCVAIFRAMGCLQDETALCKVLALKFTVVLQGQKLCNNFLCGPVYDQADDGHRCKGQLQCLITKRRPEGICPIDQICCAP